MNDQAETPVVVPASAVPAQLASVVRAGLVAAGGYMAGRGWIDESTAGAIVSIGAIILPLIWAQFTARNAHKKAVTMAEHLPDRVATIK